MYFRSALLALAIASTSMGAMAQTSTKSKEAAIADTVSQINQSATIGSIKSTPIKGLNEVMVDGTVLYISDDGNYLIHGTMLDVKNRQNLTELAGADTRRAVLASIKDEDKIIFKPKGAVKHRITVFTDVSCGYCHKLHENISGYLAKGIQVEYVAFPRGGAQSPVMNQMKAIWCAKDRNAAYTAAMEGEEAEMVPGCKSPVAAQYAIGDKIGVQGTPAVYTQDGVQIGGFVTPQQLAAALDKKRSPGSPDAAEVETLNGEAAADEPAPAKKVAQAKH